MKTTYTPPFAPTHSSTLSISLTPTSPKSPPITVRSKRSKFSASQKTRRTSSASFALTNAGVLYASQPAEPMPWLWSCHKCQSRYPLGATRRCLHDGHYFCGGVSTDPRTGRVRRHKPCGSEFDYEGWEELGNVRRKLARKQSHSYAHAHGHVRGHSGGHARKKSYGGKAGKHGKDCVRECLYPSACHWRAKEEKAAKAAEEARTKSFADFLDEERIVHEESLEEWDGGSKDRQQGEREEQRKLVSSIRGLFKAAEKPNTARPSFSKGGQDTEKQQQQSTRPINPLRANPVTVVSTPTVTRRESFVLPKLDSSLVSPSFASSATAVLFDLVDAMDEGYQEDDNVDMHDFFDVSPTSTMSPDFSVSPISPPSAGWSDFYTKSQIESQGNSMDVEDDGLRRVSV